MRGRWLWSVLALAVVVAPCAVAFGARACHEVAVCGSTMTTPVLLVAIDAAVVGAGAIGLAWVLRAAWLMGRTALALRGLLVVETPPRLARAASDAGIADVTCVDGTAAVALCAAMFRPRILVTTGLVDSLGSDELEAVLRHENAHAAHRDPLRRALRRAAADVLVFLPIVRWWADRGAERDELSADRAVLTVLGPAPLARALLAASWVPGGATAAAFTDSAEARVAQLLGEPVTVRRPPLATRLATAVGGALAGAWLLCLASLLPHPI